MKMTKRRIAYAQTVLPIARVDAIDASKAFAQKPKRSLSSGAKCAIRREAQAIRETDWLEALRADDDEPLKQLLLQRRVRRMLTIRYLPCD